MKQELINVVIFDQHEVIRRFEIVDRNYRFDLNANYVVTGLRRAGKTTLLYKVVLDLIRSGVNWDQIIYINFEYERLSEFRVNDFNDILAVQSELSDREGWFFLDEVQNIEGWEKFARRLADSKEHAFITGSNARMLSHEIEERLGGRYLSMYVTPYSFREYLMALDIDYTERAVMGTKAKGRIVRSFDDYLHFGGFPETLNYEDKRGYVTGIYQKVLLGDIASRNGIRNYNGLRLLIKKLAESVKDEKSYTKLHNMIKSIGVSISKDSVIDYIEYTRSSFLIFAIRNYFSKFVDKETTPKYYFSDNGLLNLFLSNGDSRLLENLVAIALHNKYKDGVYYLKSQILDIDFFVEETGEVIQVAYSINDISNDREMRNLAEAAKSFRKAKKLMIITKEEEMELTVSDVKIEVIPCWKFLLSDGKTR